ncbi:unnamed protein product, partial [Meganyctiphanes norvegica]
MSFEEQIRGRGFEQRGSALTLSKKETSYWPMLNVNAIIHGYQCRTRDSRNLLSKGNFNLCQWSSNNKKLMDQAKSSGVAEEGLIVKAYSSPPLDHNGGKVAPIDAWELPQDTKFIIWCDAKVKRTKGTPEEKKETKGVRDDIDEEDDEESYYRYIQENPNAGKSQEESEDELEYDEDGNPIAPKKPKYIDPLPPIDHSTLEYQDFTKNFYQEHADIAALEPLQVLDLRNKLGIKVSGFDSPKPVTSFGHFGFDEALMKSIRKSEYTQPTPIQSQAIPIALSGRDSIGIAKTGSGKTAAFIWPMLVHIMDQRELAPDDGPIGLILAPTRELALQIHTEAKRFGKVYNIQIRQVYTNVDWRRVRQLLFDVLIVASKTRRLFSIMSRRRSSSDLLKFTVLNSANDINNMYDVRSICDHVRPDRQTLLFSATFKRKVERLARDVLTDPVRVIQGELGEANQDITQIVLVMAQGGKKWDWLLRKLVEFTSAGSVLIFVTKKANAEELANNLINKELEALLLHGDISQFERNEVITAFKKKEKPILVATDVAARGLDIPHIKTVVNYDVARDIDTHTHRIGRTGRAGEKGMAYTLVTDKDKEFAGHLVRNLEGASQEVPTALLLELAMTSSWFRKSRFRAGKAKALGGRGLGFRERPGLGAPPTETVAEATAAAANSGNNSVASSNIGPATQAYGGGDTSISGPATNRLAAMKAAFQSQYKNQFTAASPHTSWTLGGTGTVIEKKKRERKSRWDD